MIGISRKITQIRMRCLGVVSFLSSLSVERLRLLIVIVVCKLMDDPVNPRKVDAKGRVVPLNWCHEMGTEGWNRLEGLHLFYPIA
jgi:hypothetical protein